MQDLRELVGQLRAENERLRQERFAAVSGPTTGLPASAEPLPAQSTASTFVTETNLGAP